MRSPVQTSTVHTRMVRREPVLQRSVQASIICVWREGPHTTSKICASAFLIGIHSSVPSVHSLKPPNPYRLCIIQPRSAGAACAKTFGEELPWDEEPAFTRVLLHEPDLKETFFKPDVFHTVSLGMGRNYAASSLAHLQRYCDGSSIDARLLELSANYVEFCKDAWLHEQVRFHYMPKTLLASINEPISEEHSITNYVSRLTRDNLGWKSQTKEASGGWNKGALTTSLCLFIEHLSVVWDLQHSSDERDRLIVPWQRFLVLSM